MESSYHIIVRDTTGFQVALIDDYDYLKYSRMLNGQGSFEMRGAIGQVDPDCFTLDAIVEVWRKAEGQDWARDFSGFHRFLRFWHTDRDLVFFASVGPSLENLLRRRIIVPPAGSDFLTISDAVDDMMRQLVRTQMGALASTERQFPGLVVEDDRHEGSYTNLNFRYTSLATELETLVGMGADFGIEQTGPAEFTFRAWAPDRGKDRRIGNSQGNAPLAFSLEMGNMRVPQVESDRLSEVTFVYVGGAGTGAARTIVIRGSLVAADLDSPWNRSEEFLEARQETSAAALATQGDAFLVSKEERQTFNCQSTELAGYRYRTDWDLGDLVTGYYRGVSHALKVSSVEVEITTEQGEAVRPIFTELEF